MHVKITTFLLPSSIHRVKWRHISVVAMRSPFCRSTRRTVCSWTVMIRRVIRVKLNQLLKVNVCIIAILLRKWRLLTSEQQTFHRACPTKWRKTADMKKLCHCHPMHMYLLSLLELVCISSAVWCVCLHVQVASIVLEWINNHYSDFETDASLSEFLEQLECLMEKQVCCDNAWSDHCIIVDSNEWHYFTALTLLVE